MSNGGAWNLCYRRPAKAEGAREPTTATPLTAHPVRPAHRLPLAGRATRVWLPYNLLAEA